MKERDGWIVFDPERRWLSTMLLLDGFDLMDVGEDWVLGRTRDEFDEVKCARSRQHFLQADARDAEAAAALTS